MAYIIQLIQINSQLIVHLISWKFEWNSTYNAMRVIALIMTIPKLSKFNFNFPTYYPSIPEYMTMYQWTWFKSKLLNLFWVDLTEFSNGFTILHSIQRISNGNRAHLSLAHWIAWIIRSEIRKETRSFWKKKYTKVNDLKNEIFRIKFVAIVWVWCEYENSANQK